MPLENLAKFRSQNVASNGFTVKFTHCCLALKCRIICTPPFAVAPIYPTRRRMTLNAELKIDVKKFFASVPRVAIFTFFEAQ